MKPIAIAAAATLALGGAAVAEEGALSSDRIENQAMETTRPAPADGATHGIGTGADGSGEGTVGAIVGEGREDPETGLVEPATGDADPEENWFGCNPEVAGSAGCAEGDADAPADG